MGCAMGPESSENWAVRSLTTSSIRFTGREFMSLLNSYTGINPFGGAIEPHRSAAVALAVALAAAAVLGKATRQGFRRLYRIAICQIMMAKHSRLTSIGFGNMLAAHAMHIVRWDQATCASSNVHSFMSIISCIVQTQCANQSVMQIAVNMEW